MLRGREWFHDDDDNDDNDDDEKREKCVHKQVEIRILVRFSAPTKHNSHYTTPHRTAALWII